MPYSDLISRRSFRPASFRPPASFVTPRRQAVPFSAGPAIDETTGTPGGTPDLGPFSGGWRQPRIGETGQIVAWGRSPGGQALQERQAYGAGRYGPASDIDRILAQGREQGFFDPSGGRAMEMLRRRILGAGSARRARAGLAGRLYGLDAYEMRQALLDADIESSGQTAGALNEAELAQLLANQDWIRRLLGLERGYQEGFRQESAEARRERERERRESGIGGFLGQAAGGALGGWLAPGGFFKGSAR